MNRGKLARIVGIAGTAICIGLFIREPSWPTPDKLLVFMAFVFMCFGQAVEMLKRFVPFVGLLLVYESFRGIADSLNTRVHFIMMADFDKWLFGGTLPTVTLQNWLWHGHVQWYDFAFYIAYMLHFVLPITLAIVIWKKRESQYWRYVSAYVFASFVGFLTYILYPAAPPWMASNMGIIEPITRVSSSVWAALGIHDFPSLYNDISPNAVAAVPSLHAAYATMFAIFAIRLFKTRWRYLALLQPFLIYVGTVYQGEHYVFDELVGALLGVAAYFISPYIVRAIRHSYRTAQSHVHKTHKKLKSKTSKKPVV